MKQKLLILIVVLLSIQQTVHAQIANHVVISEVYGGGGNSGAPYRNDFIELYNPTTQTINVTGWSVQYASATGSSWQKTSLSGSIGPGKYYLVQQAAGASTTAAVLPTPDATGSMPMSGTAGKVALCNDNVTLAGSAPTGSAIVDYVGFGSTANSYEGTGPTPAPSNTLSIQRNSANGQLITGSGNGWDTNQNASDFSTGSPKPQNSASPAEFASMPVINTTPSLLNFGNVFINTNSIKKKVRISFANLDATNVSVTISSPFIMAKTDNGPFVNSLQITEAERSSDVELFVMTNLSATGPASGSMSISHANLTTPVTVSLSANGIEPMATTTKISAIQGSGNFATAGSFQVEAVVTGVYGSLSPAGFYIQEEDADIDGDDNTSEGIFVVMDEPTVQVGDLVRIVGNAQENSSSPSFNQAVITSPAVEVMSSGNVAPSFVTITNADYSLALAEKYEGMRVQFSAPLTVSDVASLGQYGELSLSMDGSIYVPTQIVDPNDDPASGTSSTGSSNVAAVDAYRVSSLAKIIVLDDGSGLSNPSPTPYLDPSLQTVRVNSTIASLKGIMGYGYNKYRIQPLSGSEAPVVSVTRPSVPTFTKADIKIASFNVLNYFNGNGDGTGFPTSRGATTAAAFNIQRTKIIKALSQMNADVVGLIEIENDGTGSLSAVQDLINGLNAELGTPGAYAVVDDGANIQTGNSDLIKCAIIYKPASVLPSGTVQITGIPDQRPFLAQTFETVVPPAVGARAMAAEKFTFIVNHFKSKSGTGTGADADQGDGQGNFNDTRKTQANALTAFIDNLKISGGTERIISVGDYNAYYEEDPMDVLRAGGLLVPSLATEYSYHFSGTLGSLDHAVASDKMAPLVTVKKWNINSTEPAFLQYSSPQSVANSPYRSSDHDPLLIGVDFAAPLPVRLISFNVKKVNDQAEVEWKTASEVNNSHYTVQRSLNGSEFEDIGIVEGNQNSNTRQTYRFIDTKPLNGLSYYRLKQTDLDGTITHSKIVALKMNGESDQEFTVYPNPVANQLHLRVLGKASVHTNFQYRVVNAQGNSIVAGNGTISEINKQINTKLPDFTSGMYVVQIVAGNESYQFKFLKY